MKYNEKVLDEFIDELNKFMGNVPNEEMMHVAFSICSEVIINATDNHLEAIGFIECLKKDHQEMFDEMIEDERKEREVKDKN